MELNKLSELITLTQLMEIRDFLNNTINGFGLLKKEDVKLAQDKLKQVDKILVTKILGFDFESLDKPFEMKRESAIVIDDKGVPFNGEANVAPFDLKILNVPATLVPTKVKSKNKIKVKRSNETSSK
jgi:hypothetical protein